MLEAWLNGGADTTHGKGACIGRSNCGIEAKSPAFSAIAVAWPLALACAVSFVFYQTALRFAA